MERNDKCFCGSGKKYKKCHYHISGESKLADMYRKNAAFDEACQNLEITNLCVDGCSICCSDYFFVSENEFLMIAENLMSEGESIESYIEKAKNTEKIIQEQYPELIEKMNKNMSGGQHDFLSSEYFLDTERLEDFPKCIFLNEHHKCSIYNVRPIICRTYGTMDCCDIIANPKVSIQQQDELMKNMLIRSKDKKVIIKRPYPLFYWFARFFDKPLVEVTYRKIEQIRKATETDYFEFSKNCIK